MFFVQFVHNMHDNRGILPTAGSDRYFITFFEEFIIDDSLMNLVLEALEKTFLANRLQVFRSLNECFFLFAHIAKKLSHIHPYCCKFNKVYKIR